MKIKTIGNKTYSYNPVKEGKNKLFKMTINKKVGEKWVSENLVPVHTVYEYSTYSGSPMKNWVAVMSIIYFNLWGSWISLEKGNVYRCTSEGVKEKLNEFILLIFIKYVLAIPYNMAVALLKWLFHVFYIDLDIPYACLSFNVLKTHLQCQKMVKFLKPLLKENNNFLVIRTTNEVTEEEKQEYEKIISGLIAEDWAIQKRDE